MIAIADSGRVAARHVLIALMMGKAVACGADAASSASLLDGWLDRQQSVLTWSAELRQTRRLRSLHQPLVSHGRVWFKAPHAFRWELGDPPRTVAVREADRLVLLYPLLKRAEVYPLGGEGEEAWRGSLALLEAGFPRDRAQLESQFEILSMQTRGTEGVLKLRPRQSAARRWLQGIEITFETTGFTLTATELEFADGSRLRNDFTQTVTNLPIEPDRLEVRIPPDYAVAEPAAGR